MTGATVMDRAEAPSLEKAKAFAARRHLPFIGGQWVEPAEGRRFETFDPATTRRLAEVAEAGEADADAAVRAARSAMERAEWSGMKPAGRALACAGLLVVSQIANAGGFVYERYRGGRTR